MHSRKTNKLFFDKFVYKISMTVPFANYFRNKNLAQIKLSLQMDELELAKDGRKFVKIGPSWSKTHASADDIKAGLEIVDILENNEKYNLRIEGKILSVYTNDESSIDSISNIPGIQFREVWKPADEKSKNFLLTGPRAIIRKNYSHKYKVTVKALRSEADNFKEWAAKLPKIKLTSSNYRWEGYFYVSDEKTLSMCRLFLGDKVKKVEELVTESEI
jgi:hypothetical protein